MRIVLEYLVQVIRTAFHAESTSTMDGSQRASYTNHRTTWTTVSSCTLIRFVCLYSAIFRVLWTDVPRLRLFQCLTSE
ncbi:uncharacterized protein BJ212DRAFT_1378816 [Suillus subaureus]|uniref:Uncharacterized protein n=1 Tax=Suillus subaureus TaxID=48587 RepID=A0A9P7E2C0_9AGAM|nr:uncharacterized protein BJ212DRAFT_1378816 [Suillus subaureus]KAG1809661.1 hypothetical protein BJ212DRAFT_1378816 [Suillus subaureus]